MSTSSKEITSKTTGWFKARTAAEYAARPSVIDGRSNKSVNLVGGAVAGSSDGSSVSPLVGPSVGEAVSGP